MLVIETAYVIMRKPSDKDILLSYTCSILSPVDVTYVDTFWQINPPKYQKHAIPSPENVFAFLVSRGLVHLKTAECQVGTLGELPRNRMASKVATKRVFHSKRICIALMLFLNCSRMDTPDMGN